MSDLMILGPPGTGKTTAGIALAKSWYAKGAGPMDVAYLAFTRSAARQAGSRIVGDEILGHEQFRDQFPLFRTIHSLCLKGMRDEGDERKVITSSHMKKFSERTGLRGRFEAVDAEDMVQVLMSVAGTKDDWGLYQNAYALSRLTSRTPQQLDACRERPNEDAQLLLGNLIRFAEYKTFVNLFEEFKEKEGLIDFTDMLEYALRNLSPINSRFMIADEFQDLCALHHAILDRLFEDSTLRVRIGDDDQTIFKFSGARPDLFLGYARRGKQIILRQTYRFGQPIVDFSKEIIIKVGERVEKNVIGLEGRQGGVKIASEWKPRAGYYFILHRHVAGCKAVGDRFIEAGIPFKNERGKYPMGSPAKVAAYEALSELAEGKRVPFVRARRVVEELLPSTHATIEGANMRLVVHGAKKKLGQFGNRPMTLHEMTKEKVLTLDGERAVKEKTFEVMKHTTDLEYYEKVQKNGYKLDAREGPVITTIHGSKGRQAPHVVVYTEMGKKCWDDPDSEHRVAYVAATRTKSEVTLVEEETNEWMSESYPYPEA